MAEKPREAAVKQAASVDWQLARAQSPARCSVLGTSLVKDVVNNGDSSPKNPLPA